MEEKRNNVVEISIVGSTTEWVKEILKDLNKVLDNFYKVLIKENNND